MLDPLLYRWGVPPVVIRCVHRTMQMEVLQTWISTLGLAIVMTWRQRSGSTFAHVPDGTKPLPKPKHHFIDEARDAIIDVIVAQQFNLCDAVYN